MSVNECMYYLQECELAVLLAGRGVDHWYGFELGGIEEINREKAYFILFQMTKKGIVYIENDKFVVAKDFDRILTSLQSADQLLHLLFRNDDKHDLCFYIGEQSALLQLCGQEQKVYRVGIVEEDRIADILSENGFSVESNMLEGDMDGAAETELPDRLSEEIEHAFYKPKEELVNLPHVTAGLFLENIRDRERKRVLLLGSYEARDYLIDISESNLSAYYYSDRQMRKLVGGICSKKQS